MMIMEEVNIGLGRCDSCQGGVKGIRNLWRGVVVMWKV